MILNIRIKNYFRRIILKGDNMAIENKFIKCNVDHCKHNKDAFCSLDKIQVAKCKSENEVSKEATMCDSYKKD
jgi:hypothetical protein